MIVQSLWIGNSLTRLEIGSIKSFLNLGYEFHLYTYENIDNIPTGTTIKDAEEIMDKNTIFTLKETLLPFSDIWRYKLLYEKGGYWVDLDMIALKPFDFDGDEFVFSSERTIQKGAYRNRKDTYVANIGILKAPPKSQFYLSLFKKCMNFEITKQNYKILKYMILLRNHIVKYNYQKYIKPPHFFCPLDWWNTKESYYDIEYKTKYGVEPIQKDDIINNSYTIHFWRNISNNKKNINFNKKYDNKSLYETVLV